MKIFYIANTRMPIERAHGIQIAQTLQAFGNLNLRVELIIPWRFNDIKKNVFEYYGVEKNFKVTKLPCLDLMPLDKLLGNFVFWVQTITFLISAKIYLLFKKYDVLYTREQFAGLFFKDFILEIHSLPEKIKAINLKIWRKSKGLVVLTSFLKEELVKAGVSSDKILVSPDAVDFKKFDIDISEKETRGKLNLPLDKKIVLYTGSFYLYGWKGVDVLLETARQFSKLNDQFSKSLLFVFVGSTRYGPHKFKDRSFDLKNILVVKHQPHEEIPFWLKSADVLVLPNKKDGGVSEKYTSPLKLFEYMASKRPIVASDLPSIREILNENNSILVRPDNSKSLAGGIKKVLENDELADRISNQAYEDVKNYTWDKRAESIIGFINKNKG